jgi:tetratricopeptide (TPR) repeat protein
MAANEKMQELETVLLTEDLPEYGLKRGEKGVIVEKFSQPEEAYMLEFVDESGASSKMADWVKPGQIKPVKQVAKEFLDQGFELLNKGDYVGAERAFKEAVALYPKDISNIGESLRRSFADADAIFALENGLAMVPDNAILRENLRIANEAPLNLQREFVELQFEPIQTHEYQLAA